MIRRSKIRGLPADPEGMNDKRAEWAGLAATVFQQVTGTDDEDVLCDLLTDLRHWADRNSYDYESADLRATDHYAAETLSAEVPPLCETTLDFIREALARTEKLDGGSQMIEWLDGVRQQSSAIRRLCVETTS